MKHLLSTGNCPECDLSGEKNKVYLNRDDLWECPKCHLTLQTIDKEYLAIEKERGHGHLTRHEYNLKKMGSRILLRQPLFEGDDRIIKNEIELQDYLNICNKNLSV